MSTDYPSSNPFRRKSSASTGPSASAEPQYSLLTPITTQKTTLETGSDSADPPNGDVSKKPPKKVRVQSPPPPSPSIPDSTSTVGADSFSIPVQPPTHISRNENDLFHGTTDSTSDDEVVRRPVIAQAPANPFQKTLETLENPGREGPTIPTPNIASPGRASLDVEAFKRLLMTGNAGLGIYPPPAASQTSIHHGQGDGASSTDTASLSRQSIFEAIQEAHSETPRTSHDISEPDDDRRGLTADVSTTGRKKPPPPSSRHGKLIKIELRDEPSSVVPLASPPSSSSSNHLFGSSPSLTDLNKPLPPAPTRASHDSEDRESIFDKESAGKTPEPPSPSASIRRKTPPAPPLARRHSQRVPNSRLTNQSDTGKLSPKVEEDNSSIVSSIDIGRLNNTRAPPPPPTRRPASVKALSFHGSLTPPSTSPVPPVPPARGSSRSISGRPPSISSLDIHSPPLTSPPPKRSSMPPPPPPPHRHGKSNVEDGPRRTSSEHGRRSMDSARRGSEASSISHFERVDESLETTGENKGAQDILAEMSRLQADIDALRLQSEKEQIS